jgi:hypothetical protein
MARAVSQGRLSKNEGFSPQIEGLECSLIQQKVMKYWQVCEQNKNAEEWYSILNNIKCYTVKKKMYY